jgi:hypothetical protein
MDTRHDSALKSDTNGLAEPVPKITYLQRRGRRYWFRYAIPRALQGIIGKPEFLASLNTTDLATAKQRLLFEVAKAHATLRDAQRRLESAACTTRLACETDPDWVNAIKWLQRNPIVAPSPRARIAETLRALTELESEFGQDTVRLEVETWLDGHNHLSATGMLIKPAVSIKKKAITFEELLHRFREDQSKGSSPKTELKRHGAGMIVQNDRQPRARGFAIRIDDKDVERGVIGLPKSVRRFRAVTMNQFIAVADA